MAVGGGTYPTNPLATPESGLSLAQVRNMQPLIRPPHDGLQLNEPYRKVIWSIAVQLGRRFGQLWPTS